MFLVDLAATYENSQTRGTGDIAKYIKGVLLVRRERYDFIETGSRATTVQYSIIGLYPAPSLSNSRYDDVVGYTKILIKDRLGSKQP